MTPDHSLFTDGSKAARGGNLVVFRRDADFFLERAEQYLMRCNYPRALRALERTVKLDPDNPHYRWNLAQCLSEMGQYEAANGVLREILERFNPPWPELRYHMALNHLAMDEFEEAQRLLVEYMETAQDEDGLQQAEWLLHMIAAEVGETATFQAWLRRARRREEEEARRDGRWLMQQGRFTEAAQQMTELLRREPDNLTVWNNLSVACWYAGHAEKAVQLAETVLQKAPDNVHALCNLTMFRRKTGPRDVYQRLLRRLLQLFPLHYDDALKLGTTLGILGEHRAALLIFYRMLRHVRDPDPVLYYYAAAAAANLGRMRSARQWWRLLASFPGLESVASYYLRASERAQSSGRRRLRVPYQLFPGAMGPDADPRHRADMPDAWRNSPVLQASAEWGLRQDWRETQRAAIRALAVLGGKSAENALREYLQREDVAWPDQAAALFALQRMGARGRVEIVRDGQRQTLRMSDLPKDLILDADPAWREVWVCAERWFRSHHRGRYVPEARRVWTSFLRYSFVRADLKVHKPEVWAAGLVYATLRRHGDPIRQRDVAESLGVSVASVRKSAARLQPFFVKMPEV
ncbi:MAG: tetratricopeptide repeat protein [Thermoflavifilum sp.]|nr:tetratricopeptide repeat protein [Thermoflavifilum sp.]MCL6514161.1 tetratricopeptide repeat protein [Alicyclobacillus sp.]